MDIFDYLLKNPPSGLVTGVQTCALPILGSTTGISFCESIDVIQFGFWEKILWSRPKIVKKIGKGVAHLILPSTVNCYYPRYEECLFDFCQRLSGFRGCPIDLACWRDENKVDYYKLYTRILPSGKYTRKWESSIF